MFKLTVMFIIIIHLVFAVNSYGYLDAGTGSYFIQILIAFIAAGLFSLKMFWKRVLTFIRSIGKKAKDDKTNNKD